MGAVEIRCVSPCSVFAQPSEPQLHVFPAIALVSPTLPSPSPFSGAFIKLALSAAVLLPFILDDF